MKRFNIPDLNSASYWDSHQTALDFGLRQQKYCDIIGDKLKVCELGCGLSPFLSGCNAVLAVGVDFSPETCKTASEMYPEVEYIVADCRKTPLEDKSFDAVVAGEVIEHLPDPENLIKEMERLAKDIIVISTPNLEFEDPEHLWEFDEEWFKERGFTTETVHSERFKGRSYIFAWKNLH